MFIVTIKEKFSSAHFLREYKGKCENLHGHNYLVEISILSEQLNNDEMVIDFTELKILLKEIINELDHRLINEIEFFKIRNPTSENIAYYIYCEIKKKLDSKLKIGKVRVWETDQQYAEYYELD